MISGNSSLEAADLLRRLEFEYVKAVVNIVNGKEAVLAIEGGSGPERDWDQAVPEPKDIDNSHDT